MDFNDENDALKVLHTPARFHPFTGGVENHVRDLGKELVDLAVHLLTFTDLHPAS